MLLLSFITEDSVDFFVFEVAGLLYRDSSRLNFDVKFQIGLYTVVFLSFFKVLNFFRILPRFSGLVRLLELVEPVLGLAVVVVDRYQLGN